VRAFSRAGDMVSGAPVECVGRTMTTVPPTPSVDDEAALRIP
jgi:hypothetical protein